ncbi:MAG: hypothetical protein PHS44_06335 [Candidatus Dojkabacteria bacterium]|nr:hypothetical protein [Candidatus Dojkabacteria bacterium]
MKSQVELTQEELAQIGKGKIIIVRPKGTAAEKGAEVDAEGESLLVLDVREYPRAEDLFKLEQLDWIATEASDIVKAVEEMKEKYPEAGGFVAIELAKQ